LAQDHLDSLSGVDAAFLHQEGHATHMHIGGIALFEGPVPEYDELLEHIRSRLCLVPRYRQKLAAPALGLGRWRWIDDPNFNLRYHVRHIGVPGPGDGGKLLQQAARLYSQRLDRTKPLWELYLVDGLSHGRWALVSKTHHAVVDGIAGVDLMTALLDLEPDARRTDADRWQPRPEPSGAQLAAAAVNDAARELSALPGRALGRLGRPSSALVGARRALEGLGEIAWAGMNPPPDTPLNVTVGPHRRLAVVPASLDDFRAVKNALGGTVNDVVLAVVAGALRRWLHDRGRRTEGVELRAGVPVSVRAGDERGAFGNRLAQVLCPLPVFVPDPVERLRYVTARMQGVKDSGQALGAEVIAAAEEFAPPTILAQASRMNFSTRLYNLLVTNVPGPQVPLYLRGRHLQSVYPVPFLAGDRALAVAAMSYEGRMNFGLLADYDALPDLDQIAEGIRAELDELVALATGPLGRRRSRTTKTRERARAKRAASRNGAPGGAPSSP
jgi:WS/DGAT/MGAT family acyltransferase